MVDLIAEAKCLASDEGENTEYDRALVELVLYSTGHNSDDREIFEKLLLNKKP